ncbi:hypothetical protein ABT336_12105 [Micromonospora sp. NPDC000207]|uniref:hypothetical protein n=1 Tax=Micromonospora sp. NPDC000207 TaxID=3154246 RepID=UPI00331934A5
MTLLYTGSVLELIDTEAVTVDGDGTVVLPSTVPADAAGEVRLRVQLALARGDAAPVGGGDGFRLVEVTGKGRRVLEQAACAAFQSRRAVEYRDGRYGGVEVTR